jgi:polysaccharide export outer membrane protein
MKFAQMPGEPTGAAVGTQSSITNSASNTADNIDLIRVGDTLLIAFSDLPILEPPTEQRVKDDGSITLMQNQTFQTAGKTRSQLEKEIRERYVPRFFRNMTVNVSQRKETQFYYVDGEVKMPSRQIYISRTTVLKAIASANGFTDFAKKSKVKLTRVDGRTYVINCKKALIDPRLDLEVFPGDKIMVPRRMF